MNITGNESNTTTFQAQENGGFIERVIEVSEEVTSKNLMTVIAMVISAIIIITLLFIIAIFIDCRQQKHEKTRLMKKITAKKFLKLPKFKKTISEDRECFADQIVVENEKSSTSTSVVES